MTTSYLTWKLRPQEYREPSEDIARLWPAPEQTCTTSTRWKRAHNHVNVEEGSPNRVGQWGIHTAGKQTWVGSGLSSNRPFPNRPFNPEPHESKRPLDRRANVCCCPQHTCTTGCCARVRSNGGIIQRSQAALAPRTLEGREGTTVGTETTETRSGRVRVSSSLSSPPSTPPLRFSSLEESWPCPNLPVAALPHVYTTPERVSSAA